MKIIILTLVLLACVDTIQCQDKTSKNDKGLELSEFYKYAEENKEALKYQDGYSVDDLYDKPDEYSGFESMNKSRNSSSLQVYIDCGINRNLVLGGQLSDAELDKTSKNDKGVELSDLHKYAEENKEALKYQDGYSVDDLYDKPDEYSGFESMNKSRNSSSLQVYIDCGINRNLVLGGQLSDAELDKICDRRKKERGNKDAINVLIGIVGVILAVTFYNNWLKPGTDKQKK